MGNINCCENIKTKDKVFNLEDIFLPQSNIIEKREKEIISINVDNFSLLENPNRADDRIQIYENAEVKEIDYTSNLQKKKYPGNLQEYMEEKNAEKSEVNWMKLIRPATFSERSLSSFKIKFIEELNKARTDFMGISEKLYNTANDIEFLKKIEEIENEEIRRKLIRTKEDLLQASRFFWKLNQDRIKNNQENLTEIIEIEGIDIPIPTDKTLLNNFKYYNLFLRRFKRIFSKKFKVDKISYDTFHKNPEIAFILFICKDTEKLKYLFQKENKYIGLDYIEDSHDTNLMTVVVARD